MHQALKREQLILRRVAIAMLICADPIIGIGSVHRLAPICRTITMIGLFADLTIYREPMEIIAEVEKRLQRYHSEVAHG